MIAKQIEYVSYESVQQKSVSDTEKLFSGLTKVFAGYVVIHAVVSLFLNHGFTQGDLRIIFLMFVIAVGSFAICSSIRKNARLQNTLNSNVRGAMKRILLLRMQRQHLNVKSAKKSLLLSKTI